MIESEILLGLPGYQITGIEREGGEVRIMARYSGPLSCPHCGRAELRNKDRCIRRVRHEDWGVRHIVLLLEGHKWQCRSCGHYFRQRFPGILPQLVQLGQTRHAWSEEIVCMWRFSRNNGITEGFHNKMELINRQAYGFRNFQNYRLRVKVLCS